MNNGCETLFYYRETLSLMLKNERKVSFILPGNENTRKERKEKKQKIMICQKRVGEKCLLPEAEVLRKASQKSCNSVEKKKKYQLRK